MIVGTEDEHAIDIRNLRQETGYITLDNGYMNTGSTTSAITYIDGEKGILRYRGYPIEELAEKSTSSRPLPADLRRAADHARSATSSRPDAHPAQPDPRGHAPVLRGLPADRHPMAILSAMVTSLSAYYPDCLDRNAPIDLHITRLLSKVRTIAAFSYKKCIGQPFIYPKNSLNYCGELPPHDVRGAERGVRGLAGAREGAQPAAHPARRPRAELLDLDGAHGRQLGRQPLRLDRGRHPARCGARCTAAPTRP